MSLLVSEHQLSPAEAMELREAAAEQRTGQGNPDRKLHRLKDACDLCGRSKHKCLWQTRRTESICAHHGSFF